MQPRGAAPAKDTGYGFRAPACHWLIYTACMNLSDTTRMIMAESVALPDLMKATRYAYDELSAGRQVSGTTLRWMTREAGLNGVFKVLGQKYGQDAVKDMLLGLEHEIGRQALVGSH